MAEDEMVGWYHRLYRHEFEQAPGDGEGQGSLVCCSPWGHKELDTTGQLNSNNNPPGGTTEPTEAPISKRAAAPVEVKIPGESVPKGEERPPPCSGTPSLYSELSKGPNLSPASPQSGIS